MEELLRKQGPKLSGELIEYIVEKDKTSKDAARKRLSRLKPPVTKIKGLFSDNQAFYHLHEQYKKPEFYDALLDAFIKSGKKYHAIINAIEFHYGYVKKTELSSYSFSPVKELKGHKIIDNLIDELIGLDVLVEQDDFLMIHENIASHKNFNHNKAVEIARNLILFQFSDWSRNIGLTSYNTSSFHSQFGLFSWAFVSPSYISSLTSVIKEEIKPAFVIADILIGNKLNIEAVNFHIQKVEIIKKYKNLPKFLPIIIVDDIELEALNALKEKGIVIGFVDQLFGQQYKELLKSLINVVTNAGAILKKNPEAYIDLITKLNKLVEGKTNNMKGDLFELAVGYYHSRFCQNIDIGKLINYHGERREIDVLAVYEDKVIIAECKGYKGRIDEEELASWVNEKASVIRKWCLDIPTYKGKAVTFEFWSSGGYTEDAVEFIKTFKSKKLLIEFIDEEGLLKKSRKIESRKFTDILKQYYIKEI